MINILIFMSISIFISEELHTGRRAILPPEHRVIGWDNHSGTGVEINAFSRATARLRHQYRQNRNTAPRIYGIVTPL
jgi:hypothetical protein